MAFRNLIIENPAHISVRNQQLLIRTDREHSVALEDISALLLESNRSTITTAALSQLGQCGCAVFLCDDKHLPCAVTMPFLQHSRGPKQLQAQMDCSEPRKKQLWQSIVKAKITNQALCLEYAQKEDSAKALHAMTPQVRSGDIGNMEATAAQYYFPALFGADFIRSTDNSINSGLNYGYAILRGCMARYLTVYGFLPAIGLHHKNNLNSFNLADDLMEPFRPVVDLLVAACFADDDLLTPDRKRLLFNCLNLEILSGGQRHSVAYAMERLVRSLGSALSEKSTLLCLPQLLDLKQHSYE